MSPACMDLDNGCSRSSAFDPTGDRPSQANEKNDSIPGQLYWLFDDLYPISGRGGGGVLVNGKKSNRNGKKGKGNLGHGKNGNGKMGNR